MKTRTLLAATATALFGLAGGGFFHQAQAIDVCQEGDLCADLVATAESSAPSIIPDPTKTILFDAIDTVRFTVGGVVLPAQLTPYEQTALSTINGALSPFQPTVIATTSMALTTTNDTIGTVRSIELPNEPMDAVCEDRHGEDHPGKGQGHDKNQHCDNLPKLPVRAF